MKRILFVDDEPRVLQGLRQALSRQRERWDMVFVDCGEAALAALAQQPFDAIITDLAMPGMDGPALLAKVRALYPQSMRLSVSGHADEELFLRAVPVTHQFLSKPCDPDELMEVIERACTLQAILQDQAIRALVGTLDNLPSTPETFHALSAAIAEPNAHTADITAIVSKDTALCVKTLQIVNSAYFGLGQPISSIQAAVTYVGMEMIRALALSACVFAAVDSAPGAAALLQGLQARSINKARLARTLLTGSRHVEQGFTAALLADIGQAVLALSAPQRFGEALTHARSGHRPMHVIEAELFGVAHPEVGAYLLGLWGLRHQAVEAIAHHHRPTRVAHSDFDCTVAVYVASLLAGKLEADPTRAKGLEIEESERVCLEKLGILSQFSTFSEGILNEE